MINLPPANDNYRNRWIDLFDGLANIVVELFGLIVEVLTKRDK